MDSVSIWEFLGGKMFVGFVVLSGLVQLAWYVAVLVLLFKIWGRVKHLPAS